jgi:hypothetical protein
MAIDSATSVIEDKTKDVFADVTAANAKVSSQIGALSGAFSAEAALMDQKNLNIFKDALRTYMMSADDIIRTIEQKQSIIEKGFKGDDLVPSILGMLKKARDLFHSYVGSLMQEYTYLEEASTNLEKAQKQIAGNVDADAAEIKNAADSITLT